jgi:hypothetical protein
VTSGLTTFDDLLALCNSGVAEGLQLEFKLKENPASPDLSKLDKRAIAEAVSSFANSDGGTLVYGVRTERQSGCDVAAEMVSIAEIDRFLSNFRLVCALNISPEVTCAARVIYTDNTQTSGYLVCEVERSDRRPHMSTAPGVHSYYRRSFDGSALMTPSEISDQILAVREALLKPTIDIVSGGTFSDMGDWLAIRTSFSFGLANFGSRICKNPFLRVQCDRATRSYGAGYDRRLNAWKMDIPSGALIHVDDAMSFFDLQFSAWISLEALRLGCGSEEGLINAVRICETIGEPDVRALREQTQIDSLNLTVIFGAENAAAKTMAISFDRDELAARILVKLGGNIRDIVIGRVGIWRSDLVEQVAQRLILV